MGKKTMGGAPASAPATLTLARSGRVVALTMPDLYQIVTTDCAIPNQALEDILALWHYGALLPQSDDETTLARLKRLTAADFELAKLCLADADLILAGDAAPGDLTPSDLSAADLTAIRAFFLTGGSPGVPAPTDNEPGSDTDAASASAAVADDAGGADRA